jgi:hypothetical protein
MMHRDRLLQHVSLKASREADIAMPRTGGSTCFIRAAKSRTLCCASSAPTFWTSAKRSTLVGPSANTVMYTCKADTKITGKLENIDSFSYICQLG